MLEGIWKEELISSLDAHIWKAAVVVDIKVEVQWFNKTREEPAGREEWLQQKKCMTYILDIAGKSLWQDRQGDF